jgi:hypothetical protein
MTDIAERLHVVREHLRTGRFGQREVWEDWLAAAAAEVERLTALHEAAAARAELAQIEVERLASEQRHRKEPKP